MQCGDSTRVLIPPVPRSGATRQRSAAQHQATLDLPRSRQAIRVTPRWAFDTVHDSAAAIGTRRDSLVRRSRPRGVLVYVPPGPHVFDDRCNNAENRGMGSPAVGRGAALATRPRGVRCDCYRRSATTDRFLDLRCSSCFEVWAGAERRAFRRGSIMPVSLPQRVPTRHA